MSFNFFVQSDLTFGIGAAAQIPELIKKQGMTNVMVDDMDFYLETVNQADSNEYKFNGQWKIPKK